MSLAVPASRAQARQRNYSGVPSATWGAGITASATPHALTGTPTEIVSSSTYEAEWIKITCQETFTAATNTDSLLNIYIGGAGSEVLFIDSLLSGWAGTSGTNPATTPHSYWFPVRIPRGTRISGELRALIASDTIEVLVELGISNGMHWIGSGVETLGEDTAASEGTDVTPGTTAEGTWTAIGTTGRRYRYIIPGIMGNNDTTMNNNWVAWDIGTGSAALQGMEDFVVTDLNAESQVPWSESGFFCDIPSGTALQARGAATIAPSGLQTVCLYGVY